ncbi:glutathione peroxidase [Rhodobacter sp. Har01]|uniref:glutathione peroxidase n=1 Tax=Rhodobacter sp. Har01 TaxID=2883999 RepID=UPI001D06CFD1|nr:glutathione peroxidase [Rhodobacter sp. Har01]MCB6178837.1 glutathione peroxidase [Rhodobacter sp. Har01]
MPRLALLGALTAVTALTLPAVASAGFTFAAIDGGTIDLDDWAGHPVLVVNTASLCGFAGQFDDLQNLHDELGPQGLRILAVPSDDFAQELDSEAAVKDYCVANFDLTLPMTEITHVTGAKAHPFYAWLKDDHGFEPGWNFNKVLLGPAGQVVDTWGAGANPQGAIRRRIEALLP